MGDFVDEKIRKFKVDGKEYGYKPTTAGEENEWINEYVRPDGTQDWSQFNKCKLRNLKEVPWSKEEIKGVIGIEKEWKDLNKDQRWKVLSKLKPALFTKIVEKIESFDGSDQKKN